MKLTGKGGRVLTPDVFGGRAGRAISTQKLLGGTFMIAVAMATIGQTKGGLPPPRRYAAIVLLWFIFGLAAELGGQIARFTGALAALVTLAMSMGAGGRKALSWIQGTAAELGARPESQAELSPEAVAAAGYGGPLVGAGSANPKRQPRDRSGGGGGGGVW